LLFLLNILIKHTAIAIFGGNCKNNPENNLNWWNGFAQGSGFAQVLCTSALHKVPGLECKQSLHVLASGLEPSAQG
jgi:hypothetical protein